MTQTQIPFSQAALNNQSHILHKLEHYINGGKLLEMGFGTGQHAEYMSENLDVSWTPADIQENQWIMRERIKHSELKNLQEPKVLRVGTTPMYEQIKDRFDYIYTANTLHIMSEDEVIIFCREVAELMKDGAYLFLYGPFKFHGCFTSDSNIDFDLHLKARNPLSGIRDFEVIERELRSQHILFEKRYDLPANNQLLVFRK